MSTVDIELRFSLTNLHLKQFNNLSWELNCSFRHFKTNQTEGNPKPFREQIPTIKFFTLPEGAARM